MVCCLATTCRVPMSAAGDAERSWRGRKTRGLLLKNRETELSPICPTQTHLSYAAMACPPCRGGSGGGEGETSCIFNSVTMATKTKEAACRKLKTSVFTLMPMNGCWM